MSILVGCNAGAAGGGSHMKLATTLFQNLFPTLNVTTVRLASCQVPPALCCCAQDLDAQCSVTF